MSASSVAWILSATSVRPFARASAIARTWSTSDGFFWFILPTAPTISRIALLPKFSIVDDPERGRPRLPPSPMRSPSRASRSAWLLSMARPCAASRSIERSVPIVNFADFRSIMISSFRARANGPSTVSINTCGGASSCIRFLIISSLSALRRSPPQHPCTPVGCLS